jgi:GT2 family glycosyltransferase
MNENNIENNDGDLGIVVNYYSDFSSEDNTKLLVDSTALSLRLLKINPSVDKVVLADGSKKENDALKKRCEELDVTYLHAGKEISYVDGYNIGWRSLDTPYIGLMANDIIPHPFDTMQKLLDMIKKPDIGCVFPYMNTSRLKSDETQKPGFWLRGSQTCEPTSMTLNLNIIKREILEKIGGLDENYLYGFQEPILILKLRSMGYRVVLVGNTRIFHYDKLTKNLGQSSLKGLYKNDVSRWYDEYHDYADSRGIANIALWRSPFTTTISAKVLWWFCYHFPISSLKRELIKCAMWLEPFITKYPAKYGK